MPPGETSRYVTEQLFHHVWHGGADATEVGEDVHVRLPL